MAVRYAWAVLGVAAVTVLLAPFTQRVSNVTVALAYLLVVLFVAARWGSWPAFVASVLAMLTFNFFFLPPIYRLTIEDPQNWVALGAFAVTALVAGRLSERARRRTAEAEASREVARAASEYNRSLIEASLDAMAAIGPTGRITDVNAAVERLTGRSRTELVGTDFADCFTDPERARAGYREAFREGKVQNSTLAIVRRDGRIIPVLYDASVYRDDQEQVVGVFVVAREVGEHVAAPVPEPPPRPTAAARPVPRPSPPEPREAVPVEARPGLPSRRAALTALALVPPLVAVAIQMAVWPFLRPFAWFLFYPAVFLSAWVGGRRGGILATALSTLLVWWFFLEPEHGPKLQPRYLTTAAVFALTGSLVSVLHGRLQTATRRVTESLAQARRSNEMRQQATDEIARLVEQASDGIFLADDRGRLTDVNAAGCHLLGYSREELLGTTLEERMPPEDQERQRRAREQLLGGGVQIAEFRLRRRDGVELPVEVSAKFLPGGRWQGFVRDVSERKRAERELQRVNRAHRALSKCNEALIRAADEQGLLEEVCRLVVEEAGYRMCWIGRAEQDDARTVRPLASAGFEEGYLKKADIRWSDTERGRGPTGTSIRERRTTVARDFATDPSLRPWRAAALERGYASSAAIPLILDPATNGAMTIYAVEPDAFGEREVALLSELADDVTYGIATLRTRTERNKAQEELRSLNADLEHRVSARTAELRAAQEREAETGSRIQRTLLLDDPPREVAGIRVAALSVPSQHVAGDFYGFFLHEDSDCLDVLVADVMGKGIPAALLAAAAKAHFPEALWHLLATSARAELPEPKDIVTLAHAIMARRLIGLESFVTSCYARFDVSKRVLTLVDCGHTGALHLSRSTGQCTSLHGDNLPLGVREGEIYDQISAPLEVEDVVLFFSDGVTEARAARGELFGTERLIDCVTRNVGADPAALVAAVHDAAASFTGQAPLRDDLTCVAVELVAREEPLARADLEIRSTLTELRRTRDFVGAFCAGRLDETAVAALVLAVNEAASNVMKHAYRGREDQRIDVTAWAFGDRIAVRLRHLGAPFDPSSVGMPSFDGSRDSGFGVFLIGKSVDVVRYYRDDLDRRCVRIEKRRG